MKKRNCKQCGQKFTPYNSIQPVCSPKCALEFNSKKEVEKRHKQMKLESKKLSDYEQIARIWFQKWIRKRDEKQPCISCGKTESKQWDGGHYRKAEIYSGVIFHENNVHKQCSYCNDYLHGNEVEYRAGLINRIGLCKVEELERLANETRYYKWTREELKEIANKYKQLLKTTKLCTEHSD